MPLYEYYCKTCGYTEEKRLTYKEGEKTFSCPKCGAKLTKKIGNICYFKFKGMMTRV